jgi:hypothetical protein
LDGSQFRSAADARGAVAAIAAAHASARFPTRRRPLPLLYDAFRMVISF